MSHFTSVKTKIKDLVCLIRAVKDLGYSYTQATVDQKVHVRGYARQKTEAIMSIHVSKTYDVGVTLEADGTYAFVADWWGVETTRGVDEEEFVRVLTQRYSYHKVIQEIRKKGYVFDEEEEEEKIQIKVRTWS